MPHFAEEIKAEAETAIAEMRAAAAFARRKHAAAELIRHMLTTTAKSIDRPRDEAIEAVASEWMGAWHLDRDGMADVAAEIESLTGAFYDYIRDPSDTADVALREAWFRLKRVHDTAQRTLEDQMAWRSVCAHGWWGEVSPAPAGYRDHDESRPRNPFWDKGCPDECL